MEKLRIPLASAVVAIVCSIPAWSQTATLTGHVLDRNNNQPINGARVSLVNSPKGAISNSDGSYTIIGLPRGRKMKVTYAANGYGTMPDEVPLDTNPTQHDVHLYRDIPLEAYWIEALKGVQADAAKAQPGIRSQVYGKAWQSVEGSTLSPEAKSSAAQAFAKAPPDILKELSPSFQAYESTDLNSILKAKNEFGIAIKGNAPIQGRTRVPNNVAADIAAHQMKLGNGSTEIPNNFLEDFKGIYGDKAVTMLKDKVTLENLGK